ncbi:histidine kinase dimerization/phospho-acceptor domain-containing protein, partial [Frankia sp. EI5c]|uniref:histidine kinase dimerization/phospho-acceptor domain-containing protein n=1 Tax=Frankia sp. EI5c TaxID=683316 RepID=UPI0037C12C21
MTRIVASTPGPGVPGGGLSGHNVTGGASAGVVPDGVLTDAPGGSGGGTDISGLPADGVQDGGAARGADESEPETAEESVDVLSPATLDLLPDPVVVTDATGTVELFNAAASKVTGLSARNAVGRHVSEVLPLLDERGNDWWECSQASRDLPRVTGQPERRLTYAGPVADHDFNVTARFTRAEGVLVRVALCLRDTVSRERIERNRADLIATVAHELRSPLTSVKGFTATLLARWDRFTDEQKKLMLNTVNTDADRVTR